MQANPAGDRIVTNSAIEALSSESGLPRELIAAYRETHYKVLGLKRRTVSTGSIAARLSPPVTRLVAASRKKKMRIVMSDWPRNCVKAREPSLKGSANIPRTTGLAKQAFWCSA